MMKNIKRFGYLRILDDQFIQKNTIYLEKPHIIKKMIKRYKQFENSDNKYLSYFFLIQKIIVLLKIILIVEIKFIITNSKR